LSAVPPLMRSGGRTTSGTAAWRACGRIPARPGGAGPAGWRAGGESSFAPPSGLALGPTRGARSVLPCRSVARRRARPRSFSAAARAGNAFLAAKPGRLRRGEGRDRRRVPARPSPCRSAAAGPRRAG